MTSEPLIPFIELGEIPIIPALSITDSFPPVPISVKPFGTLVALGAYIGSYLAVRQARRVGLDPKAMISFVFWIACGGFLLGHALDTIFYYPGKVLTDPLSLIRLWEGLSSFGGFAGAIVGMLLWRWRYGIRALPYSDVVASSFPVAWVFGRAGCTLAHDHPGMRSDLWIAVQYPDGGRFDLGLYEMLLTLPIAAAFLVLRRKPRPWGFYLGVMLLAYTPGRFALDFLRSREPVALTEYVASNDPRYAGLTPAQWASFLLLAAGAWILWRTLERAGTPEATLPPEVRHEFR